MHCSPETTCCFSRTAATLDEIEGQVRAGRLDSRAHREKMPPGIGRQILDKSPIIGKAIGTAMRPKCRRQVISQALTAVKNEDPGLPFGARVRRVEQVFVGFDPGEMETSSSQLINPSWAPTLKSTGPP